MSLPVETRSETDWVSTLTSRGFRPDGNVFLTRRPDQPTVPLISPGGARVVAKFFPSERGPRAFANMMQVWRSSFGRQRTPPGLPEPLDYFPDCGALIMERLDGLPLAQAPAIAPPRVAASLLLLAELHGSDVAPENRRSSRTIVRSAERKAARIAELSPPHGELARTVATALAAARVKEREMVPAHGDFSPRNVLVGTDRLSFIDWDRLQWADPARDVVYFATYEWADSLRRGRTPSRGNLHRAVELYESARPAAKLRRSLSFHVAASCLRRAASILELWPEQSWLAPAWLRIACRELESAG